MQTLKKVAHVEPSFRGIIFTDTKKGARRILTAIRAENQLTAIRAKEFVGHSKSTVDDGIVTLSCIEFSACAKHHVVITETCLLVICYWFRCR